MREHLSEDRGPHFRVWDRPALPGLPGLCPGRPALSRSPGLPQTHFGEPLHGNAPHWVNIPLLEELHRLELS